MAGLSSLKGTLEANGGVSRVDLGLQGSVKNKVSLVGIKSVTGKNDW